MLDGNLFVVITREDDITGMHAIAQKIPMSHNLARYAEMCKTLNVCRTWKDAQELAKQWNMSFWKNGSQKIKLV